MRIDAGDGFPAGNSLADEVQVATRSLKEALDFLNVDVGFEHQRMHLSIAPMYEAPGYLLEAAGAFKRALPGTIIGAAGRIVDPVMAESIIEDGISRPRRHDQGAHRRPRPARTRRGRGDLIRSVSAWVTTRSA